MEVEHKEVPGIAPRTRALRRVLCGGPQREDQPTHSAEDQVNAEEEADDPEPGHRPAGENDEAGDDAEDAGEQEQPARFRPMAESEKNSDHPARGKEDTEDPGQEERAGERLAKQDHARGDVEKPEQNLAR